MPVVASSTSFASSFELRNASLALTALVLKTTDLGLLARALEESFGQTPLFDHDPVAIDLSQVAGDPLPIDFEALARLLRDRRMLPVGVEGGSAEQMESALASGLGQSNTFAPTRPHAPVRPDDTTPSGTAASQTGGTRTTASQTAATHATATQATGPDTTADHGERTAPTVVVDRPLRSGQQVYARNADLVVLAAVNFGAEVIADGHIHVYAPLRGRAVAGARGNASARIFSTCMEAQLIAIAGTYRTTETALPADVQGKPAQVRLAGDALVVEPLSS